MQIAKSFDGHTLKNIRTSAWIAFGGWLLTAVPFTANELTDFLTTGDPINWKTPIILFIGAVSTWVVNTVREWMKGVDIKTMPMESMMEMQPSADQEEKT